MSLLTLFEESSYKWKRLFLEIRSSCFSGDGFCFDETKKASGNFLKGFQISMDFGEILEISVSIPTDPLLTICRKCNGVIYSQFEKVQMVTLTMILKIVIIFEKKVRGTLKLFWCTK